MQAESGARQMTVDFDSNYGSCTLSVIFGKEDRASGIVIRAPSGRLTMLESATAANTACSVKEGNVFDNE